MVLRKITIDNNVRYIPKNEKPKERDSKPKTTKAGPLPTKQNENISRNSEKFLENVAASGFGVLTKWYAHV